MKTLLPSFYKISFLGIFLMACLGQFQRIQLHGQVAFYLHEVLLIAFLVTTAILVAKTPKLRSKIKSKIDLSTSAIFSFIAIQTLLWQLVSINAIPLLYLVRLSCYLLFPVAIWFGIRRKLLSTKELYGTLLLFGGAITFFGLVQYLFFPDTRFLFYLGWDDHYFRLISTLFDPGFAGIVITITLLLFLAKRVNKSFKDNFICAVVSFTSLIAVLLTYSRATYLAFGVGMLVLAILKKQWKPPILIAALIVALPFLPRPGGEGVKLERIFSAQARVNTSVQTLQQLQPINFVVGQGWYRELRPSNNGLINTAKTTDNSLLFVFVSMGAVGSLILLWWIWIHRVLFINSTFLPVFGAVFIHSMFNNTLFYNFCLLFLGGVLALSQTKDTVNS